MPRSNGNLHHPHAPLLRIVISLSSGFSQGTSIARAEAGVGFDEDQIKGLRSAPAALRAA